MAIAGAEVRAALYRDRAIGTRVEIAVSDAAVLVGASELLMARLAELDLRASRFRDDSEISRANAASGTWVEVSPELFELVTVALEIAGATDGAVDPTVGAAMVALGYDRDFALVAPGLDVTPAESPRVPGWRSVSLRERPPRLLTPVGTLLDLGATAKAWAADAIATEAAARFGCGVLVSLGGDVAVAGPVRPPGFGVGIADVCTDASPAETLALVSGGLATSGTAHRRWRLGGRPVHHIVDPCTATSSATPWRTVSVVAGSCLAANAAATAAIVKGLGAPAWLTALGLPARLVGVDGVVRRTPGWPDERLAHPSAGWTAQ